MKLYLLGTGTPTPTPSRFGSAYVLQIGSDCLLFDCGPATTHKLVKAGLLPTQVDYLFFTHHHFDHDVDYPCFLLTRWDQGAGREHPLQVYGPPPTEALTQGLIGPQGVFSHDWRARIGWPSSQAVFVNRGGVLPRPAPVLSAHDVGAGEVLATPRWQVTAAQARHAQPWLECLCYRVDSDEGSIVFTGDTAPCESLAALARGAGTLVSMCWDHQETMDADGEAGGQSGTVAAAEMARGYGVSRLIASHSGPHLTAPGSRERGIADMAARFAGEIIFAEELIVLDL